MGSCRGTSLPRWPPTTCVSDPVVRSIPNVLVSESQRNQSFLLHGCDILGFETCLVIGFLLGPMLEMALRQTMLMHKTDLTILITRPISLVFLLLTLFFIWHFGLKDRVMKKKKKEPVTEAAGD